MTNYFDKYDDSQPSSASIAPEEGSAPSEDSDKNYFDKYTPEQQAQQTQSQGGFEDPGEFGAFMEKINRNFGRIAEGTLAWGAKIGSAFGDPNAEEFINKINNVTQTEDARAAYGASLHPKSALAGDIIGGALTFAPAAAATGGMSVAGQVGANALIGAGMGLAKEGSQDNGLLQGATNVATDALGGAAGTAGGAVAGGLLGNLAKTAPIRKSAGFLQKVFNPQRAAQQTVANEISNTPGGLAAVQNKIQQADDLGVNLSWADAAGTDSAKNTMKNIPVPDEGLKGKLIATDQANETNIKGMLSDTIEKIAPKGTDELAEKAYKELTKFQVNKGKLTNLMDNNPVIGDTLETVTNKKTWDKEILDLPDNNAYKLNEIKRLLGKKLDKPGLDPEDYQGILKAKKGLESLLDTTAPKVYKKATMLGEQVSFKKKTLEKLAEVDTSPGRAEQGDGTFNQIYNKLWNNPKDKEDFLTRVTRTGGDAGKTEKLINLIDSVRDNKFHNLSQKEIKVDSVIGNSTIDSVKQFFNSLGKSKYRKEMVELLIDSKKWAPQVEQILSAAKKDPSFLVKQFKTVLEKISNQKATLKTTGMGVTGGLLQNTKIMGNN